MTWTLFIQVCLLVILGAWIYSCGKAGASLMAPVENMFHRAIQFLDRRRAKPDDKGQSIAPPIRS